MPDRDTIFKMLPGLPETSQRDESQNISTLDSAAWRGSEYGADYWVTNEAFLSSPRTYVLRTRGDEMAARAQIERDFTLALGTPDSRTSERGIPVIEVTSWNVGRINQLLNRANRRGKSRRH